MLPLKGFMIGDRGLSNSGDIHPEWNSAFADFQYLRVIGASATGQDHIRKSLPRDDAFVIRTAGDWLAASVSDGLGSHHLSRYGASQAVEALTSFLLQRLMPEIGPSSKYHEDTTIPLTKRSTNQRVTRKTKAINPGLKYISKLFKSISSNGYLNPPEFSGESNTSTGIFGGDKSDSQLIESSAGSLGFWSAENYDNESKEDETAQDLIEPEIMDPEILKEIFEDALLNTHNWLTDRANQFGVEIRDIGCTCLGLLINLQTSQIAVGQVGDGAILGLTTEEEVWELVEPFESDDLTQVIPITSSRWEEHMTIKVWAQGNDPGNFQTIYLMSDGVSADLLYTPDLEALKNWAIVMNRNVLKAESAAQAATQVLDWLATYQLPGSWDDRTLVILARTP